MTRFSSVCLSHGRYMQCIAPCHAPNTCRIRRIGSQLQPRDRAASAQDSRAVFERLSTSTSPLPSRLSSASAFVVCAFCYRFERVNSFLRNSILYCNKHQKLILLQWTRTYIWSPQWTPHLQQC